MPQPVTPEFHTRFKRLMRETGVTASALATTLAVNTNQIYRWQKDQMPGRAMLEKIAEAMGVPWEWLLVGDEGAEHLRRYMSKRGGPGAAARSPQGDSVPAPHPSAREVGERRSQKRPRKQGSA